MRRPSAVGCHIYSGAFTLGMSKRFDVLAQLEEGLWGAETFKLNFPKTPHYLDARVWPLTALASQRPSVVFANPPCACWSAIGAKLGDKDPRFKFTENSFYTAMALSPEIFVMESVPRAWSASPGGGKEAYTCLSREAGLRGYQTTILLTNALLHGGNQSRERFHFIVHRPELSIPTPWPGVFPSVNEVIGDLADSAVFLGEEEPRVPNHVVEREKDKYNIVFPELRQGERWNDAAARLLERGVEAGRGRFISYRLIGDVPCGTIADVNALIHPTQSRHLTVREGARLCGYPDDFVFATDSRGRAQASDVTQAVLPTMGEYLGGICARSLDNNDAQPGELNVIDFRYLARIQLKERKDAWKASRR